MATIDRAGTYTGVISESTLGQSAKGYPQWQARLTAQRKWVTEKSELDFYKLAEPAYVPWEADDIVAYLVLFNDDGPLKNYHQLTSATGWDGQDFRELLNLAGKKILFRVEEDLYDGKTFLRVKWIDAEDAPVDRTLKSIDAAAIVALNAKYLGGIKKVLGPVRPATAAKPKTPPTPPAVPPVATVPSAPAVSPVIAEAAKPKTPPTRKPKTPPVAEPPADGPPKETTKEAAWEYISTPAVKGANEDSVVEEAWIAACAEVGPDRPEASFTPVDWARVRDTVVKDLAV